MTRRTSARWRRTKHRRRTLAIDARDAISIRAGTCGAAAAPRTPKAARKTAREVVRRTLLAKGSGRLSKDKNGTMGEGRARRGTLPKEKDAPADVDGATVAPPQRRRTPSMYLGGAPRESESEKRLRESIRALGAETRIRMELDRATAKERRQKRLEALRVQAEQALASLEELPEVEKRRVRNQGILSLYSPENLTKREKIREDPRVENILGKWWAASLRYDDKDRDEGLNRSEYAAWHGRELPGRTWGCYFGGCSLRQARFATLKREL